MQNLQTSIWASYVGLVEMNRTESQNNEKGLTYRKTKEYKKEVLTWKVVSMPSEY